jgi:hypothetical protein
MDGLDELDLLDRSLVRWLCKRLPDAREKIICFQGIRNWQALISFDRGPSSAAFCFNLRASQRLRLRRPRAPFALFRR